MIYKPVRGSSLTLEQAQRYGEHIETLIEENNGSIVAAQVVDDAKAKSSPLHDFFEWNDKQAAIKWRLEQARYVMGAINVIVTKDDGDEIETRAFHYVSVDGGYENRDARHADQKVVVTVQRAMAEEELRRQVVETAMKQLKAWRKKYDQYSELSDIFTAIDKVQEELGL